MELEIGVENNNVTAAFRHLLVQMLDKEIVEAVFVPLEFQDGMSTPALVTDRSRLEAANPFIPLMPINHARAVSSLTTDPEARRIAAVLRPCEIRAVIELVKLKQASLENLTIIGVDCPGTFELTEYRRCLQSNGNQPADLQRALLCAAQTGQEVEFETIALRPACRMCVTPTPEHTHIHVRLFGVDSTKSLPITVSDELAQKLDFNAADTAGNWDAETWKSTVDGLVTQRQQKRTQELEAIRNQMTEKGGIASLFRACVRCHNCMTACPICYCKTCLFKTAAFDHEPAFYLSAAKRKGAQRMLGDTVLFHLTRMHHMSTSCVSCGMCTSACPSEIPVGMIFTAVGERVQAAFEYVPGREVEETLPLVTFRPDEWTHIGETQ